MTLPRRKVLHVLVLVLLLTTELMAGGGRKKGERKGKRNNRCRRFHYVQTIKHPTLDCEVQNVLMARCEGACRRSSRTDPVIEFSFILRHPFQYRRQSCQAKLSKLKAVRLKCTDGTFVTATYRYITKCACAACPPDFTLPGR
ncbi:NDP [Branchiostoma lanceolatum]|uniref:NDP protein n=1 Tax=Branchiostoma lanceolatum TaxID=7740 RepID=A0A8J9Z1I4_BRALA|nr:NDP [Branchiostoma lanceolatum]